MKRRAEKTSDTISAVLRLGELREALALLNPDWPQCRKCGDRFHPDEFDPMYRGFCSFCGVARLEVLFRRLVNAPLCSSQRRAAIAAIKRFASR